MAEAFSVSDAEWAAMCAEPSGTWLMPVSGWPAVPKTSSRGLRFFAHHPGYPGVLPTPESYAHTRLKIDIARAARTLGFQANLEVRGQAPSGAEWIADVLVDAEDAGRTAFEVQLSSQHLNDFRSRTERYERSGIRCCWVVSERSVGGRLAKAIVHENKEWNRANGVFQADVAELLVLSVPLDAKSAYHFDPLFLRIGRGRLMRRLLIEEAVEGVLRGAPRWERPCWHWDAESGLPFVRRDV